jgi:hypothetical protein
VKKSRTIEFALICCISAWAPSVAQASLINGSQLHISGDFEIGATTFNWQCNQPGDAACASPPAGAGDFAVSASTGSFAEYNSTFGLITDLNNALEPLNRLFSLPNFMTFDLNNDLTIELIFIPLGDDPVSNTCAGLAHCTPQNPLLISPSNPGGLSALNLDSNAAGTALTFGLFGVIQAGGATANVTGIYDAEFVGLNAQQTLVLATGGSNSTYSANLSLTLTQTQTSAPEPTSIFLGGIGLVGLGLVSRVRRS